MIPGGLTEYLQPLDFSINKPFKGGIKKKNNEYWLEKGDKRYQEKKYSIRLTKYDTILKLTSNI